MVAMFDVNAHIRDIERICRRFGVKRLEFFGSAVTDSFGPKSDVDCVIEFEESSENAFHRYFDLKYALEELLGREVDLVVDSAITNPYFRRSIDSHRQLIYAA